MGKTCWCKPYDMKMLRLQGVHQRHDPWCERPDRGRDDAEADLIAALPVQVCARHEWSYRLQCPCCADWEIDARYRVMAMGVREEDRPGVILPPLNDTPSARRGDWMQTYTGRQFWVLDPRPEEIDIDDIGQALSQQCRYAGHTAWHYSVAQHCWLMAEAVPEELAPWALLHDASEAYILDIPNTLKPYLPGYKEIEECLMRCIAERFGLSWPVPPELKEYDRRILLNERDALLSAPPAPWFVDGMEPLPGVEIWRMSAPEAKSRFMQAFGRLFPREVW